MLCYFQALATYTVAKIFTLKPIGYIYLAGKLEEGI